MVVLVRFTVFWIHGGLGAWGRPKRRPPLDRHTHTRGGRIERTQKTLVFWELLKNPIPKDDVGYLSQRLWAVWSPSGIRSALLGLRSLEATGCAVHTD